MKNLKLVGIIMLAALSSAQAATWTKCATENGTCSFNGKREIKYGTPTKFTTKVFTNRVGCNNSVFGDPAYGILKTCWYSNDVISSTPAPTPVVTTTTVQKNFTSMSVSASVLPNPEKGWDGWSGEDFVSKYDAGSVKGAYDSGSRQLHCQVSLAAYRSTPTIPASFLTNLSNSFSKIRAQGMKCVMLFAYNQDSSGNDATAANISAHLKALKPVLYANADVISYVKAGFIGAWGEWHSSKSGNSCGYNSSTSCAVANPNRVIVRDALLDAFPPSVTIQFRYPADIMSWYPTAQAAAQARVGLHNDCMQSSSGDTGTYTGSNITQQQTYIAALSALTPYGGEHSVSCSRPFRTSCADILAEGAKYHQTWEKGPSNDIADWVNAWKSGGCYNEVMNRMGYRIQLDSISHPDRAAKNATVAFNVGLRNVGWAKVFSARKLQVVLVNGSKVYTAEAAQTLTALPEQATASTTQTISFKVPSDATAGTYNVYLRAPDVFTSVASRAEYAIRFANSDANGQAWDAANSRFSTGSTLIIQ